MSKYEEQNFNNYQNWVRETNNRNKISDPKDVFNNCIKIIPEIMKEHFIVFALDTKNKIIKSEITSTGSLNANIVHPREVFKFLILNSAAHFVVAHNHPSGDPEPSREDIEITKKLKESGEILGITLLDHVIVGADKHYSMKESGNI